MTRGGNYGRSDYDARHRLSIDAVWNIPGFANGFQHYVTSGWMLSPVITLHSGQPFTVYTTAAYPSGDFNADGYNYDAWRWPNFKTINRIRPSMCCRLCRR